MWYSGQSYLVIYRATLILGRIWVRDYDKRVNGVGRSSSAVMIRSGAKVGVFVCKATENLSVFLFRVNIFESDRKSVVFSVWWEKPSELSNSESKNGTYYRCLCHFWKFWCKRWKNAKIYRNFWGWWCLNENVLFCWHEIEYFWLLRREDWALSPITENRDKLKDRGRSGKGLLACQPENLVYGVTFTVGYNDCKS